MRMEDLHRVLGKDVPLTNSAIIVYFEGPWTDAELWFQELHRQQDLRFARRIGKRAMDILPLKIDILDW